jgi:hypothetical protein
MRKRSDLERALKRLDRLPSLDERGRIRLLVRTQSRLNNGDAMEFFGHWLDGVCELLGIDDDDPEKPANHPI